jgi:hypothetical protein
MLMSQRQQGERRLNPAAAFVWTTWALLLTALLLMVTSYPINIPLSDAWDHIPVISGELPVSSQWLWAQEVNHPFPIAKLVWILSLSPIVQNDTHIIVGFCGPAHQ